MTRARILLVLIIVALLLTTLLVAHPGAADSPYQVAGTPIQQDAGP